MKVTNPGDRVTLAFSQEVVDAGQTVDVPDHVGAQLVAQGWLPEFQSGGVVPGPKPKPARVKAGESITPPTPAAAEQED